MEYAPVCIISGQSDNLVMMPHRNSEGDMVGWFFVQKDISHKLSNLDVIINHKIETNFIKE